MLKNLIIIACLCFGALQLVGQENGTIRGILLGDNEPVDYANLVLRAELDSSIVKASLSDSTGGFEFLNVPYGDYYVEAIHLSYDSYSTSAFNFASPSYDMGTISITSSVVTLGTATVKARRPLVQRKIDRLVVNVEASLLASGGTAVDVLEIAPGVMVNRNGSISIAGKSGVLIFINGRQTYLSGSDLIAFLENLSAEELSQIEIMTNPPARFDASGNAGVINIRTKKLNLKGYNASLSLAYRRGKYPVVDQSSIFNYRNQRINLYGNLGLKDAETFENYYIVRNLRDFETNELETVYNQTTNQVRRAKGLNARVGLDYYLSDKTTLGLVGNYFLNESNSTTDNNTVLSSPDGEIETTIIAPSAAKVKWDNYNFNLNLLHEFSGMDHSMMFDLDFMKYNTTNRQSFDNFYYQGIRDSDEDPFLHEISSSLFPQEIQIYSLKGDYIQPILGNRGNMEFGFKTSYVRTDNLTEFFDLVNGEQILDLNLSNQFRYTELINAAYANFNYQVTDGLTIQAGLRAEKTDAEGEQQTTDQSFTRNNLQLFPTFYVSQEISDMHQVGLSYGRRIERPDYQDMNPFREFLDQFTFREGNPNLRPQISNNFEFNYIGLGGKLAIAAYYNQIDNVIQESISQNVEETETFIRPENLASSRLYGAYLATDLELSNFFTTNIYLNVYNQSSEGIVNENPFSIGGSTFSSRVINIFDLGDGWRFDAAGWYTSRSIESTFVRKPFGKISFGLQKRLLDGDAVLRFTMDDAFNWNRFEATSNFQNIDVFVDNRWQSRTWRVSLRYKFRRGDNAKRKNRDSSIDDEQSRVRIKE